MGNQQINLLQHMLCSLISSGDIRLRGTRKERGGGKEALSLEKKDCEKMSFRVSNPASCEKMCL